MREANSTNVEAGAELSADSEFGDAKFSITPGTSFKDVPSEYECPVCEASKTVFELVKI